MFPANSFNQILASSSNTEITTGKFKYSKQTTVQDPSVYQIIGVVPHKLYLAIIYHSGKKAKERKKRWEREFVANCAIYN